jgi:hypothetical protein
MEPLKVTCTSVDCDNDLHCFLQKKKRGEDRPPGGPCRACGADLVTWERIQARDPKDVTYTFRALNHELIRHEFFHRPIDQHAQNHARRKGRIGMRSAAEKRLRGSVGNAKNVREGQQTPFARNILFYAQHALACCCRKCMEYWHGIPAGRALTDDEIAYLVELIMLFIAKRMTDLDDRPVKVPPTRHPR